VSIRVTPIHYYKVKTLILKIKADDQKITYNTNEITPNPKDENDKEEKQIIEKQHTTKKQTQN
jgi:hypothetical protein